MLTGLKSFVKKYVQRCFQHGYAIAVAESAYCILCNNLLPIVLASSFLIILQQGVFGSLGSPYQTPYKNANYGYYNKHHSSYNCNF